MAGSLLPIYGSHGVTYIDAEQVFMIDVRNILIRDEVRNVTVSFQNGASINIPEMPVDDADLLVEEVNRRKNPNYNLR